MTDPIYCRMCGGKYHQYGLMGSTTTCITVADRCCWCGSDFWDARPTYKEFLKKKELSKEHVKKKQGKLKKLIEEVSA